MNKKNNLFVYSKDKNFIDGIKAALSSEFRLKRIKSESSLKEIDIRDILIFDISTEDGVIPEWVYKLNVFKILTYNRFIPENLNDFLAHFDFYISKSIPASEFIEKIKKIGSLLTRDINPLTYLPGNIDFERDYLSSNKQNLGVAFIDIDNFKYFHSAKGSSRSEMLLRMLSTIIRKNIFILPLNSNAMAYNIFLDRFGIISDRDELLRLCSFIYEDFSKFKNIFFDNSELTRQFFVMQDRTGNIYDIPITTISTVLITKEFSSIIDLYRTAEDIFRYLKSKGGNLIFSDRRQSYITGPEKGTILIAVYDQLKSNYLKIALERLGWKVFSTNDGITALKLYNRTRPAIVILDEALPIINYRDFINVLRYELSDNRTVIVLLSEIDELINSQYKFSTLSKDINADKINQKLIALLSQTTNEKG